MERRVRPLQIRWRAGDRDGSNGQRIVASIDDVPMGCARLWGRRLLCGL